MSPSRSTTDTTAIPNHTAVFKRSSSRAVPFTLASLAGAQSSLINLGPSMLPKLSLLSTFFLLFTASALAQNDCEALPLDADDPPRDGQMFVETPSGWDKLRSLSDLNLRGRPKVHFAYIVRPSSGEDRTGVLVIKTNRPTIAADDDKNKNTIRLVRSGITRDKDHKGIFCAEIPNWPNRKQWVSTTAYEDYHDYPAPDTKALRQYGTIIRDFHFEYRSDRKGGRCTRTDDTTYDDFPWNLNTNRAQFSFNRIVVDHGSYTAVGLFWQWFLPVSSPFEGTADHRTLVKKYSTSHGIACVEFSVRLDSDNYTFRINDLEGRALTPTKSRTLETRFPK